MSNETLFWFIVGVVGVIMAPSVLVAVACAAKAKQADQAAAEEAELWKWMWVDHPKI